MGTTALPILDYDSLKQAMHGAGNTMDAAEAHGIMCGVLCASTASEATAWVPLLLNEVDKSKKAEINLLSAMLIQEHERLRRLLQDPGFGFEPLLPALELPLLQRVRGLADWCRGFIFGLVAGGVQKVGDLPGDVPEILRDLLNISEVELEQAEDEEQERNLVELQEYVRAAVQTVYEELHGMPTAQQPPGHA